MEAYRPFFYCPKAGGSEVSMGFFKDDLSGISSSAASLHSQIESYLDQDLFSLVIQPIVDYQTGCAFTGEALTRLNHPEHGNISADVVTHAVDDMGLHSKFDLYIFRKCCIWMQRITEEGKRFDRIACNFSRKTLSRKDIARELIGIADNYKIPYSRLGIEITEWKQATDMRQISENLKQLKEAGFRIILDDYGSGVTSERDLYEFPLDVVKLDHSLLKDAETEKGEAEFRDLVAKFRELGLKVVCEGIETEAQDILARTAGCHYGQGFRYFSPASQERIFERIYETFQL